jgi:beta-barrel assembly-enhancing protease
MKQLLAGVLLLLWGGQSALPVNFFSPYQDIEIGRDSSDAAEKQLVVMRDAHLNGYIKGIAVRLGFSTMSRQTHYGFHIVNSDDISSLGFPNGDVYVYSGLLKLASNDDEVAAMLAHEIGHISARHPTAQLSRQLLVMAPLSLSIGLPSAVGWKEQLERLGVVFGADAAFLHYRPDQEREAFDVAARLLTSAKFDPNALTAVTAKINEAAKKGEVPMPAFLYNHPFAEVADTTEVDAPAAHRPTAEFRRFQTALRRLAKKLTQETTPPERVVVDDLVPNSLTYENYTLKYPEGWQVSRTGPNGAIIAPADGLRTSATVRDDITYGVIVDIFDMSVAERPMTLDQSTNRIIIYLRQSNIGPGSTLLPADQTLRVVPGAQTPMLIHGEPALRTVLLGKSQATGASELVWLVTRMYYQNMFYMVFVAPEEEFASRAAVFQQIINNVKLR